MQDLQISCHVGSPCSYTKFAGVFKPESGVLEDLDSKEVYEIMQECLGNKEPEGLVSLAFSDNGSKGGMKIINLKNLDLVSSFSTFPEEIKNCARAKYILDELQKYSASPWNLMTDMSIPCCEKNAELNETLYKF